jgi:hypothetical protein
MSFNSPELFDDNFDIPTPSSETRSVYESQVSLNNKRAYLSPDDEKAKPFINYYALIIGQFPDTIQRISNDVYLFNEVVYVELNRTTKQYKITV